MKKLIYFFPYFLTNMGTLLFFVTGCLLIKDSYQYPFLTSSTFLFLTLLIVLLGLSIPRYLIKGVIPDPFKKSPYQGFWFLAKYMILTAFFFHFFVLNRDPADLSFFYTVLLWIYFLFALYCHFFWGSGLKKHTQDSPPH